jgi:hypothetical protein
MAPAHRKNKWDFRGMQYQMIKYFVIALFMALKLQASPLTDEIPQEDAERLELFFENLIKYSTLGYSLCGDKPVSIEHVPDLNRAPILLASKGYFKYSWYSVIGLGWECWMKYADRFPSSNYCLRTTDDRHAIILINKSASLKTIAENIDLFQKLLNSHKSPQELLEELCEPKTLDVLHTNQTLEGILFGYGRNNAIAFTNRGNCQILKTFNLGSLHSGLSDHFGPGFRTLSDESNYKENVRLRKSYETTKHKIRSNFHNKKYFEQFLIYYMD